MTKKIKAKQELRKIYKDFTLDEFDEFTMDLQALGASHERGNIIEELKKRRKHLFEAQRAMGSPGGNPQTVMLNYVMGMSMAIRFIEQLPDWEDNCKCKDCEAL
jgi:argininosuccinate synthase